MKAKIVPLAQIDHIRSIWLEIQSFGQNIVGEARCVNRNELFHSFEVGVQRYTLNTRLYNKQWRCWDKQPDDQTRMTTTWGFHT